METSSKTIIADSSGLISLLIESDSNHSAAVKHAATLIEDSVRVLIPGEVLAETINILGKKFGHDHTAQVVDDLFDSSAFLVISTSDVMRKDALARFRGLASAVSFTDCLVMAVADEYGAKDVFGFDKQFEDAGYTRLQPTEARREAA
jgi:predicted nucleic acid-binding protein